MAPPKQKGQKMGLGEFLTDSSLGSWADEMEDAPIPAHYSASSRTSYGGDRGFGSSNTGSGGYQDRGYAIREQLPLPSKPPFTVHLGNMSFDATEGDIQDFFAGCEVTNVRIVEDKIDHKPKGFGYVEFATVDGLKKALELTGTQFQGRNIRVSVAEPPKDRSDGREISDWTRKGPLPDLPRRGSERPGYGAPRNFDDAGGDRPQRRQPFEQGDGKPRDFGNWERKGPLAPAAAPPPRQFERPTSHDGPRERRNSPAWGEGRSQEGSRPPRRDFSERPAPERAPTAAEQDNQWRSKMRPDPPAAPAAPAATSPVPSTRDPSVPSSPAAAPAPPVTRPKLNLQKRTVSTAEPSPVAATAASDSKSSPFGAARPIDTSAREKEIEEKIRQRKEQEDKAREEKRLADEKAKEEKRQAGKDSEKTEKTEKSERPERPNRRTNGQAKEPEQAESPSNAGRNYQILRREAGKQDAASEQGEENDATSNAPTEPSTAATPSTANGNVADTPTTEVADNDGWTEVAKPQKKGRSGRNAV